MKYMLIFQLYDGKNKLIFNEMMMRSTDLTTIGKVQQFIKKVIQK